jgi:hypothetical protein
MKEPIWDLVPDEILHRQIRRGDIVWVKKKTRGRFGKLNVAKPGDHGLVISTWTSSMGSGKICILTRDLNEIATTDTCASTFCTVNDQQEWQDIKLKWMEKTYVPIIVVKETYTGKKRKGPLVDPYVKSRDQTAILVKPLNSDDRLWINEDKTHPHDWDCLINSKSKCHSIRVPAWLAKKGGLYGSGKR